MLVVARKPGEKIIVDGPCEIILVALRQGHARIGIQAEDSVEILRSELVKTEEEEGTNKDGEGKK